MKAHGVSRRSFINRLAVALPLACIGRAAAAAQAPKETGLSSEGLLAGHAGFQARSVAPLGYSALPGFLSAPQLAAHHAQYAEAVESLKQVEQTLATGERTTGTSLADYAALRRKHVALGNDVLLHELYFGNLSATTVAVPPYVRRHMDEHMGSLERWADDFRLCALAAQAWAVLVYDPYDDRWHNVVMDGNAEGAWVGANPLVVCDVAPHAYSPEYGDREAYVGKFLDRIDWTEVAARYRRVDRM